MPHRGPPTLTTNSTSKEMVKMLASDSDSAADLVRAEALAVSDARACDCLDRASVDAVIRATLAVYGGIGGCAAELAQAFGDHPEIAVPRMRWARQTVTALY
jgi:hypothetical protein